MLTFTKKGNDSITMERTKMTNWLYYYRTNGVFIIIFYKTSVQKWSGLLIADKRVLRNVNINIYLKGLAKWI